MTGGAGFSRDASNQSRNNRNLLKHVHSRHFISKSNKNPKNETIDYKKASPELIQKIKADTIKQNQRNMVRYLLVITTLLGLYFF